MCRSGVAFLKPTAIEVRGIFNRAKYMHVPIVIHAWGSTMNMVVKKSFTVFSFYIVYCVDSKSCTGAEIQK